MSTLLAMSTTTKMKDNGSARGVPPADLNDLDEIILGDDEESDVEADVEPADATGSATDSSHCSFSYYLTLS